MNACSGPNYSNARPAWREDSRFRGRLSPVYVKKPDGAEAPSGFTLPPPGRGIRHPVPDAYCSSDMTIEDMLLDCFSMEVPACISICLAVMLALSVA